MYSPQVKADERSVAIYHVVYAHERFEDAAKALFKLVRRAEQNCPGKNRLLYLDIEGHRNREGDFDADMLELQQHFLARFLFQFVTAFYCPLITFTNPNQQNDGIPGELIIEDKAT